MAKKDIKAIYDTCRMLTSRIEAQAKDKPDGTAGNVDQNLLSSLAGAFKEILEFERLYLIKCQDRFFGTLLMDLEFDIDFKQRGSIDLKIKRTPYVLGVNPLFCSKYTFSEFTGLIVEELTRMIYLHMNTFAEKNGSKDPRVHGLLERASDAAASEVVKRDIRLVSEDSSHRSNGCRLPKDAFTSANINDEFNIRCKDNMPIEYYYDILKRFKKNEDNNGNQGKSQNNSQNQGNQNQNSQSGQNGSGNSGSVATPSNSQGESIHQWENADSDEVKETVTSMCSNALNNISAESRGFIPGNIMAQINALLAPPEINWRQVLAKMVGSIPVPYRKTRTRLNRRQPYRSDLSGKLPKRVVDVVCCFDTSGSMSDSDLEYCMNEVFNIIKVYEGFKVTIVECDSSVQRVYQAKSMADVKKKMAGRGGTAFTPAIEYINGTGDFKNNKKFPNAGNYRSALMVYFTDGWGESSIPKPKTYRNLWVVLHDTKNLSLKEPYGDVKSLSMDKQYRKMKGLS